MVYVSLPYIMSNKAKPKKQTLKHNNNAKKNNQKKKYRIKNWSEYNEALKQRGSLIVWLDSQVLDKWYAEPTGKQGSQPFYTDLAITLTLQFGKVFGQKLRQTEGLVISLFSLMKIHLDIPDYSTLSRRGGKIKVRLNKKHKDKVVLIADSTGLKVYGEGEWKVRQHGKSKCRTWRKIHLAITPDGELRAVALTENKVSDDETSRELIDQESAEIESLAGDGAYDKRKVYNKCQQRKIKTILIPPQKNAKIWQHGNCKAPPHPRDENLRKIRKSSRKKWKESAGYHIRSLAETAMFRFKTILGDKLNARKLNQQLTEVLISANILNKMTHLGMPKSYAVAC